MTKLAFFERVSSSLSIIGSFEAIISSFTNFIFSEMHLNICFNRSVNILTCT